MSPQLPSRDAGTRALRTWGTWSRQSRWSRRSAPRRGPYPDRRRWGWRTAGWSVGGRRPRSEAAESGAATGRGVPGESLHLRASSLPGVYKGDRWNTNKSVGPSAWEKAARRPVSLPRSSAEQRTVCGPCARIARVRVCTRVPGSGFWRLLF